MVLTKPKFSVKVSESDLVVFPVPHKVFLGLHIIPTCRRKGYWKYCMMPPSVTSHPTDLLPAWVHVIAKLGEVIRLLISSVKMSIYKR
jgi:hypothetical protein